MNFRELLELTWRQAKLAADIRDQNSETARLRKRAASEKDAGLREAWGVMARIPKIFIRPFQKSVEEITAEQIRRRLVMEAQTMMARRPMLKPGQTLEDFHKELEQFLFTPQKETLKRLSEKTIFTRTPEMVPIVKSRSIMEVDPKTGTWYEVRKETEELPVVVLREKAVPVKEIQTTEQLKQTGLEEQRDLLKILEALSPKKPKIPLNIGLGVMGAVGAGAALNMAYQSHRHRKNLETIIKDPLIPSSHKIKAHDAFKILSTYAPTIASDPIFSKDFVRNLIRHDVVDHKIISDLIQAEKNYNETRGKKSEFLRSMAGTTLGTMIGIGG